MDSEGGEQHEKEHNQEEFQPKSNSSRNVVQ